MAAGKLILTREVGQKLMIGDDIIITLVETKGRQARIMIEAPKDVCVDREEVRIRRESAGNLGHR